MTLETISIAMNKRIFYLVKLKFVAFILLIPFQIAQSQVYYGFKAGVNLSSVILITGEYSGRITGSNQHLLGYQVGGIAHISISEAVGFRPEVVISWKGTRNIFEREALSITTEYKTVYLEIPLNFMYKLQSGNKFFYLYGGPYIAFGLKGKRYVERTGTINQSGEYDIVFGKEPENKDSFTTYFNPLDYGINIGFGYETDYGLFAALNYGLGLSNMVPFYEAEQEPDYDRGKEGKIWNSIISLSVGWQLGK